MAKPKKEKPKMKFNVIGREYQLVAVIEADSEGEALLKAQQLYGSVVHHVEERPEPVKRERD